MKGNQKFLSGLLLGAAAGAVVAALLQGEHGEEIMKNVKTAVKNTADDLKSGAERMETAMDSWLRKGRNIVNEFTKADDEKDENSFHFDEIFS